MTPILVRFSVALSVGAMVLFATDSMRIGIATTLLVSLMLRHAAR